MSKRPLRLLLLVIALLAGLLAPMAATPAVGAAPTEAPINLFPNGQAYNANPTLSWAAIPGVSVYRVQIDDNAGFTSPFTVDTVQTKLSPYQKLPKGTNYWRVAGSQSGLGPYSDTATFTIDLLGPTPTSPDNGSVIDFPTEPAAFTWSPLPGAKEYQFQHDNEDQFISPLQITSETNGAILVGTPAFGQLNYWRVRADYGSGVQSEWSSPQTYTLVWPDVAGVGRPILVSPENSTAPADEITDIQMVWQPLQGAKSYRLEVSKNVDFSGSLVFGGEVLGTSYSPPKTFENGPYFWRVRGIDKLNNLGPWSDIWSFVRSWPSPTSNLPGVSNPPALVYPLNGATNVPDPMVFEWDPTDRSSYYELQVGSDPGWSPGTFNNCFTVHTKIFPYSAELSSGAPGGCSVFNANGSPKSQYWRVRSWDAPANVEGRWSETRQFTFGGVSTITADALTAATQVYPDNCVSEACALAETPTFSWNKVPGAAYYLVYLATDDDFTAVVRRYSVPASDFPQLLPAEELPDNNAGQAYFWHVRPCKANGICTLDPQGQTNPPSFAFQKRSGAVTLTGPGVPITNPSIPVVSTLPTFSWQDYLTSPSNGSAIEAKQYRIVVGTTPQVVNSVIDGPRDVDQPWYSPYDRTYPEGPLYWQVAAVDGSGNLRTYSDVYVVEYKSPKPVLAAPLAGAQLNGTPQFTWQGMDYARSYQFELYKNGNDPISDANRIDNRETMFTSFTPYDSLAPGAYAWRVHRYDAQGKKGPWSDTRTFTIKQAAPDLTAPLPGVTLTGPASFAWEDDGVQAPLYRFQRSATPDFSSIAEQRDTVMMTWAPLTTIPNGTWYWRVQAINANNAVTGTSSTRTFIQNTPNLPSAPQQLTVTPSSGSLTISWKAPSASGVPAFTDYVVTLTPDGTPITVSKTKTSVVVNGLINGLTYDVSVKAKAGSLFGAAVTGTGQPSGCSGTPFADVGASHPFCSEIAWMYTQGLSTGSVMGDGTVLYKPGDPVSRQAMASFLYRYEGNPPVDPAQFFGDVPPAHPFYNAIQWMGQSGLSTGTPNLPGKPLYKPGDNVSRQAMAAFVHRYAGDTPSTLTSPFFADVGPSNPFYDDVQWMAEEDLSAGTPNPPGCSAGITCGKPLYKPVSNVSRQAMAAFLYRFDQM